MLYEPQFDAFQHTSHQLLTLILSSEEGATDPRGFNALLTAVKLITGALQLSMKSAQLQLPPKPWPPSKLPLDAKDG